jgi:hypothetical protein
MRCIFLIAGMLTGGMFATVMAQSGTFGSVSGGSVSQLATNRAVQDELKLTGEQISKLKDWATDMRLKAADIRKEKGIELGGKGAKGFTPPTPEQTEKLAAVNEEIRKVSYRELAEILEKKQLERLKQIDRQSMGVNAFLNDEVTFALNITETQKTSVKGLAEDLDKTRREILKKALEGGPDLDKLQVAQKEVRKVEKEYVGKAIDLLGNTQMKKWAALTGEPFDLEKLRPQLQKKMD